MLNQSNYLIFVFDWRQNKDNFRATFLNVTKLSAKNIWEKEGFPLDHSVMPFYSGTIYFCQDYDQNVSVVQISMSNMLVLARKGDL